MAPAPAGEEDEERPEDEEDKEPEADEEDKEPEADEEPQEDEGEAETMLTLGFVISNFILSAFPPFLTLPQVSKRRVMLSCCFFSAALNWFLPKKAGETLLKMPHLFYECSVWLNGW
jgi:hypothetical protein